MRPIAQTVGRVNAESLTPCRRVHEDPFVPSSVPSGGRRRRRRRLAVKAIPLEAEPLGGSRAAGVRQRPRALRDGRRRDAGIRPARTAIALPGVECAAACDLYDGRHVRAREIAGASLRTTRRYQELLDDKEIDCIVAAVPDHWHRQDRRGRRERRQGHLLREADVAQRCRRPRDGGRGEEERADRPDRIAAHELRPLREGTGTRRTRRARRSATRGRLAGPQQSERGVGVSAAARPLPRDAGLGHLAGGRSEAPASTRRSSRAGVAGRNTARASPAT